MLSRQTRARLTIYFLGMIALNCFVIWHSRKGIRAGLPDFIIFYTAGQIVHQGQGVHLYDNKLQEAVQRAFVPESTATAGRSLPFNHPPFEALVFAPFARVSYLTAYFCWLALNILIMLSIPLVLRPYFTVLGKAHISLWLLATFAFFPNFIALVQGQDSILVLFFYCMAFAALCRKAEFRAGGWLSLGLCKFHLVLSFVLPFLFLKCRRLIAGFLVITVTLLFMGLVATGWSGWKAYPRYVLASENNGNYLWNRSLSNTVNLHGLIWSLLPGTHPWLRIGVLTMLSSLIFIAVVYAWQLPGVRVYSQKAFCIGLIATVLLSYHLYTHDLSLVFLASIIAFENTVLSPPKRPWIKRLIFICLILLSFNPIYLVLSLRYYQLELLSLVLLVLFGLLWIELVGSDRVATKDPMLTGRGTLHCIAPLP